MKQPLLTVDQMRIHPRPQIGLGEGALAAGLSHADERDAFFDRYQLIGELATGLRELSDPGIPR
jgi:hypothetical protein